MRSGEIAWLSVRAALTRARHLASPVETTSPAGVRSTDGGNGHSFGRQ